MAKVKATDQSILRTIITVISDMKQSIIDIEDDMRNPAAPTADGTAQKKGTVIGRLGSIFQKKVAEETKNTAIAASSLVTNSDIDQKCEAIIERKFSERLKELKTGQD